MWCVTEAQRQQRGSLVTMSFGGNDGGAWVVGEVGGKGQGRVLVAEREGCWLLSMC